jgi:hypothetical protein
MTGAKGRKQEPVDPMILQMAKVQVLTAQEKVVEAQAAAELALKVRDEAIHRAKSLGLSLRDIAPLMGRTVARVAQISPDNGDFEQEARVADALEGVHEALAASGA